MIRRAPILGDHHRDMAPLLICERKGRWAAGWRRLGAVHGQRWPRVRLIETRTGEDCLSALERNPAAFVLLECTLESLCGRLLLLARIDREYPEALCAAAADAGVEAWHHLLREFGAVHVLWSPLGLVQLAAMLVRSGACGEPQEATVRERIWSRLPWPEAARREGRSERACYPEAE